MRLSVIICTYDRYAHAEASAAAIANDSSFNPDLVEIVVIDNTPPAQRRPLSVPDTVRVVPCDTPGLSVARNAGITASTGDIIAFVDDDARVRDGWCGAVLRAFDRHEQALVCGGRTLLVYESDAPLPRWFFPELAFHLSCIDWGEEARPIRPGEWIVGANMAFRRSVFERFGLFDPSLGRKGTASLLSNEEIALMQAVGHDHVFYIPDMIVDHHVPENRVRVDWFRKRVFWQAISDVFAGIPVPSSEQALQELRELSACAPAEARGLKLVCYAPLTPQELQDQLRAVYLQATLLAEGAPGGLLRKSAAR